MALLASCDWPGNVRELRNAIERAIVMCAGDTITSELLPLDKLNPVPAAPAGAPMDAQRVFSGAVADAEAARTIILDTLAKCAGDQTRAAELLGTSRFALMRRLKELEIPRPRASRPATVVQ